MNDDFDDTDDDGFGLFLFAAVVVALTLLGVFA